MRILLLSWEYPPVVYGGLGRHVHALARALVAGGHEVTVATQHAHETAYDELVDGVRVVRVPEDPPIVQRDDLLAWILAFNHALGRAALRAAAAAVADGRPFDVVHAHDWLVAHAAAIVKNGAGLPLVATMHATEAGRHQGWLPSPLSKTIHTIEWWLTFEARRVITCSQHMQWEVTRLFELPPEKVDVVRNGIDAAQWRLNDKSVAAARARWRHDDDILLVYVGRLEYEKGVQTLLRALPRLRRRHRGLRLLVAGTGTYAPELRDLATSLRIGRSVSFAGFLPEHEIAGLLSAAHVAVVPSIYEPFGIVALEAAVAGTPLVVAATGGLCEIVENGGTGLHFQPDDVTGLADAVSRLLRDEVLARRVARAARTTVVARFGWADIAHQTAAAYQRAVADEQDLQLAANDRARPPRLVVRDGNLLHRYADRRSDRS